MPQFESSIVIPVFNKWELTRNCLKSLAATIDRSKVEVIVVDNASRDVTEKGCPFLGRELFGDCFRYVRNSENRNFAGASNQGAELARGEFLIFLNNDTEPEADWYQPLIDDFTTYPDIAVTGPLLVYPKVGTLGRSVQHLGILVSPFMRMGHLYAGLPETSPLAKKRRFFQAITAACMVIRKSLFMETGGFDEGYINGFEDIDFCARIREKGLRMTVNPQSVVVHHEGQSPGRSDCDEANFARLRERTLHFLEPDWHLHLKNDNLCLSVNEWLLLQPKMSASEAAQLDGIAKNASPHELKKLVIDNPYWENGWHLLIDKTVDVEDRGGLFRPFLKFFKTPPNAFSALELARTTGDKALQDISLRILRFFEMPPATLLDNARSARDWCAGHNFVELAAQYGERIAKHANYEKNFSLPMRKKS